MRILGEIVVFLFAGGVGLWFLLRRVVIPAVHRRRFDRLEHENEELDLRIRRMRGEQ